MLEVSVPHHRILIVETETTVVVAIVGAVGTPVEPLLMIVFKMFQIVNGFMQTILDTFKHFNQVTLVQLFNTKP